MTKVPDELPALRLKNVSASYGPDQKAAVQGIHLTIPRHGHTAIVGPSGAGKTALFSLILRFLEPTRGELLLDGRPYRAHTTPTSAPVSPTSNRTPPSSPTPSAETSCSPTPRPPRTS
ncbi:ATP-binding cassette domain-containing protein [Streptomyces sp. NPDC005480]|uniref:ATP-binding cassette domain-containing protein n=1 Tax=Streptomyces sp. NPDC005480 TaxID=3154880 RepID=UPI0033B172B8